MPKTNRKSRLVKKAARLAELLGKTYTKSDYENPQDAVDKLQKEYLEKGPCEEELSAQRNGFADYTPFNAITGKDYIGKSGLTDPHTKVKGGYNSAKK